MEHAIWIHVEHKIRIGQEGIGITLHGQMMHKPLLRVLQESIDLYWTFVGSKCLLKLLELVYVCRWDNNGDLRESGSELPDGLQGVIKPKQISGKRDVEDGSFHEIKIISVVGPVLIRLQRSGYGSALGSIKIAAFS